MRAYEPLKLTFDFHKIDASMSGTAWFMFQPGTATPLQDVAARFCFDKLDHLMGVYEDKWKIDLCTLKVLTELIAQDPATTGVEATEAQALELLGPTLVLPLPEFTPNEAMGRHKLHVSIELPLEVDSTPAQEAARLARGGLRGDPPPPAEEGKERKKAQYDWVRRAVVRKTFAVQIDPWKDTLESARQIAALLGLWRVNDRLAIQLRLDMERTRKAVPIDTRLQRAFSASPVVSFDEFLPAMEAGHYTGSGAPGDPLVWHRRLRSDVAAPFAMHTDNILLDSNRLKVAGAFKPSHEEGHSDGDLCIILNHKQLGGCFNHTYRLTFSDYDTMAVDPGRTFTLATAMRRKSDGRFVGESTAVEMYSGGWLRPDADPYLDLLKRAVTGWLYLKGESDDPSRALPGAVGWAGHTMIGMHRIDALQVLLERELLGKGVPGPSLSFLVKQQRSQRSQSS